MAKRCTIDDITYCDHCPHFDNEYHSYSRDCGLTGGHVENNKDGLSEIPSWCPLPDMPKKEGE